MGSEFADKVRSLGVIGRRTRDQVNEWRDGAGRHKAITDELGNTVTQHARPNHTEDRQDVTIRPPHVAVRATTQEIR
jgi:hypothetical protein